MREIGVIIRDGQVLFLFDSEMGKKIAKKLRELGIQGEEKIVYCG